MTLIKRRYLIFALVIFFCFITNTYALTGIVNVNDSLTLRQGPTTSSQGLVGLANGTRLNILDTNSGTSNGCTWYKVTYGDYTGYVCGTYIRLEQESSGAVGEDDSYDKNNYSNPVSGDGYIMCYEDTGDITLRTSANGSRGSVKASCGDIVQIKSVSETNDSYWWYQITTSRGTGWIKNIYVNTTKLTPKAENYYKNNSNGDTIDGYKATLKLKGFPDSYISYLLEIHARYPKWNFVAESIPLKYIDVINGESSENRNVLDGRWGGSYYYFDQGYYSTASHTYNILQNKFSVSSVDGYAGYYNASKEAIAYYMDPRNYLNQQYIFAFESLGFNEAHNAGIISSIISGQSFFDTIYKTKWADGTGSASGDIIKASREEKISASHVAARIKQEMGNGLATSDARLGGTFKYNGTSYSGYYNFFNIKSSCVNCTSIYAGYAKEKAWNTPYKGIKGGASFIYNDYISKNQDTLYYEKFDVSRTSNHYTHQYMQNLSAITAEGGKVFNAYLSAGKSYLDGSFTFTIPVYQDMPNYVVTAPKLGNPNNYLKDIKVNGSTIGQFNYGTYNYNMYLSSSASSVNITATPIVSGISVNGTGNISITSNNQIHTISVTAKNGKVRKYTITFIRQSSNPISVSDAMNHSGFKYNDSYLFGIEVGTNVSRMVNNIISYNNTVSIEIRSSNGSVKTNDSFRTGDKVKVTGNDGSKTYTAIIRGDINGDGLIDRNDLLYVQSKAFGYTNFDAIKTVAGDINKDGKVDRNDLLYVQSHVFGYSKINQG